MALVAAAFSAAFYVIQRAYFYEQFVALERSEAQSDLLRCRDAIESEITPVGVYCGDWSAWDAIYSYIGAPNDAFVTENLSDDGMANARVNGMWILAADGSVRVHKARDNEAGTDLEFPELPSDRFPADHPLLRPRDLNEPVTGILRTSHGPLLVASRQVIHSDFSGPAIGWLVVGRLLTKTTLAELAQRTHVDFQAWDPGDAARDPRTDHVLTGSAAGGGAGATWTSDDDEQSLHVFGRLDDIHGMPALVIRADVPREISAKGAAALHVGMAFVVVASCAMVAVLIALLAVTVVRPLARLRDHAVRVGRSDDLSAHSGVQRGDEIGTLASAFDEMTDRLRDSRERHSDLARRAGVADVARGLLHNVGNVLTGVNASAESVAEMRRTSRTDGLVRAAAMVAEHQDDLARFLTEDPRGRMLPAYFAQAAAACREEQDAVAARIDEVRRGVANASDLVSRQTEFAAAPALDERTDLERSVAGALTLVEPAMRRHGVTLERRLQSGCEVVLDRSKLTQILVNLLTNAKEALSDTDPASRRAVVRAGVTDGRIRIEVEDTGRGIAPDDLPRLFASDFSTKGRGRGLGLHFCSVTAVEMGGSLRASSDGPGRGATFLLELPVTAPGARAAAPTPDLAVAGARP